tara:strand:+ start:12182 stop:12907 length:726 start_codon:yes stop_codon:yes gene_type:complete
MSSRTDITPLSITNGKISNQAKIDPRKLAPAKEGQVLIAGKDGKFLAGNLSTTTVTNTVTTEEEVLPPNQIKIGPNTAEPGATNQFVNVGVGKHSIPRRDSSGNLKAETADQATEATNADKLDNQNGTYYTDVSNHTAGSPANTSTPSGLGSGQTGVVGTTQTVPMQMITATNTGASSGTTDYIVEHNFNSIPVAVQVLEDDGSGNLEEVETEVVSTTSQTAIKFSVADKSFTAKIIGVKS